MAPRVAYAALTLSLAAVVWLAPAPTRACSCLPHPPPRDAAEAASVVFQGKVSGMTEDQPEGSFLMFHVYTLEVERVWKGDTAATFTIRTTDSSASCGRAFVVGESYLVYAKEIEGHLSDNLCSRTRLVADADEDFAALGPAVGEPEPPPSRAEPEPPRVRGEPATDANPGSPPAPTPNTRGCSVDPGRGSWRAPAFILLMLGLGSRSRKRAP